MTHPTRPGRARALAIWTLILVAAAMVLAGEAAFALIRADEACFFQVSPCPDLQGGKVVQLQFALVGVPAIWLVGVLLGAGLRDLPARRRSRDR